MLENENGSWCLASNPEEFEIQRENNFSFIVNFRDDEHDDALYRVASEEIIKNCQHTLELAVLQSSIPHFTQNVIEIKRGNSTMKAAGAPTFDSGSLTVNDFIGADVKSILMAWQNLSYNVLTEKVGRMKDYKRRCQLIEYTPDYEIVRTWILDGCWISKISEGNYNMEGNGKKTIDATIEYDRAYPQQPDVVSNI